MSGIMQDIERDLEYIKRTTLSQDNKLKVIQESLLKVEKYMKNRSKWLNYMGYLHIFSTSVLVIILFMLILTL